MTIDHLADITAEALRPFLEPGTVSDVSVQRPGEVWIDDGGWRRQAAAEITEGLLQALIDSVGNLSGQASSRRNPLLSAELPSGERIQAVRPPVAKSPVVVVRKPAREAWRLRELERRGVFETTRAKKIEAISPTLRAAHRDRNWPNYLRLCVLARRNIVVSGPTGSGKTTMLKALAQEIPISERLIAIEDVPELDLPHPNAIGLRYSKGAQGEAGAGPTELLEACLRMRPDRILFGELRGGEAFQFLRSVNSGHPGTVTSLHANGAAAAIEQIALLARQSGEGRGYGVQEMRNFAAGLIDVVVQMESRCAVSVFDRALDRG